MLSAEELEKIENFYRYNDETGDGIASRTIPGTHPKGAYFTRGSGHNRYGAYTEDGDEYQEVMERLSLKINNAATAVPAPLVSDDGTDIAILTLGSCDAAAREAIAILAADGIKCDYLRVKGFPFCESVNDFISAHKTVFVVEQNRDAQRSLLLIELAQDQDKLKSIVHYNGMPINAACIVSGVKEGIS